MNVNDGLFWLGIALVVAGVTGAGCKILGFEFPPLRSWRQQVLSFLLGIVFILIGTNFFAKEAETREVAILNPGGKKVFPLTIPHSGQVEVRITFLRERKSGVDQEGQDEVMATICGGLDGCANEQLGIQRPFGRILKEGNATVEVFNFGVNPPLTLILAIKYPKQFWSSS